jgi:hypothetical protein
MSIVLDGTAGITFPVTAGSASAVQASSGRVLQVVQYSDTTNRSSTTNTYAASGFSASITPSNSSNKILVIFSGQIAVLTGTNTNTIGNFAIYRGSSTNLISARIGGSIISGDFNIASNLTYLDSPATTSSVTYNIYWTRYSSGYDATLAMNINGGNGGNSGSTFILMEIAS